MTTTSFDPVRDAAVREQLGEQAQAVKGRPSAGIFGDTAGHEQAPQQMDLSGAKATTVNPDDLMATLQKQQEQINALRAERTAEQKAAAGEQATAADLTPRLGNASGEIQATFAGLHARRALIADPRGLDRAKLLAGL